jgi:hypothetical protein
MMALAVTRCWRPCLPSAAAAGPVLIPRGAFVVDSIVIDSIVSTGGERLCSVLFGLLQSHRLLLKVSAMAVLAVLGA